LAGIVISIYGENMDLNNNPLQREFSSSSDQKNCIFVHFQARRPVLLQ